MQYLEEWLDAEDGHSIPVKVWRPRQPERLLVIVHGMAEHAARYAPLAEWLTEQQVAVVALEQRGHSDDCPDEELGHLADTDGWQKAIHDVGQVIHYARALEPQLPVTLFGHSMGSFVVQCVAQQYAQDIDALVLSATNRINRPMLKASKLIVNLVGRLRGFRNATGFIERVNFGAYNRHFKPNRTDYDWLSRDTTQVDAYIEDAYCGFACTPRLWSDLIAGMLTIRPETWAKDLPVHLMSGSEDGLGEWGRGIARHIDDLNTAGVQVASNRLFEGGRHELINEINAGEVWEYLYSCLARSHRA